MRYLFFTLCIIFTFNIYANQHSEIPVTKKINTIIFNEGEFVGGADWWDIAPKFGNVAVFTATNIPNEYWAYRKNKLSFIKINSANSDSSTYWELTPKILNSQKDEFENGQFLTDGNWYVVKTSDTTYILDLVKKVSHPLPSTPENISNVKISSDGKIVLFDNKIVTGYPSSTCLYSYNLQTKTLSKITSVSEGGNGTVPNFSMFDFTGNNNQKIYALVEGNDTTKTSIRFFTNNDYSFEKEILLADGSNDEYVGLFRHFDTKNNTLNLTVHQKINDTNAIKLVSIDLLNQQQTEAPLPNKNNIEGFDIHIISKSTNSKGLIINYGNQYLLSNESLSQLPIKYLFSANAYLGFIVNLTDTSLPKGYPEYLIYDQAGNYLNNHPCNRISWDYSWVATKTDGISCLSNPEYNKSRIFYSINEKGDVTNSYQLPDDFETDKIKSYHLKEISNRTLLRLFSNQLKISFY